MPMAPTERAPSANTPGGPSPSGQSPSGPGSTSDGAAPTPRPKRTLSDISGKLATSLRKRLRLPHSLGELEPSLISRDLLFEAPPLDDRLLAAIKLISPQFHLRGDEASRRFWELNQNGLCWGEYLALKPYLDVLETPRKVLDAGPGLGRSVIFFKKACSWHDVPFHLYEGSGESTKYTKAGPRFEDSFCGNFEALEALLEFNGIGAYEIFDASELDASLSKLPGPYDFIYSFFAIGFHWSIEHFLDELLGLMSDRAIGAFTLHDRFENFGVLDDVPHRHMQFQRSWPRDRTSRLVVIAKDPELLERAAAPSQ